MRPSHYPGPITNNKVMQVTHRMPSGLSSPRWCQGPAKPPWKASMEVTSGVRNCLDHFRPLAWDFVIIYLAWVGAIQDFGWSLGDYFHDPKIWRDLVYYHISSVQVSFMTFYDCHESQVHYSNYLPNGQVPDDPISIPRSKVKTPRSEGQRRNPRYCWWVSHQLLRYQLDFAPESTVTVKVKGKSSTDDIGWCGPSIEYTCIKSRNLSTPTPPHVTSGEECGTSTPLTFASISLWSNRSPMALKWKSQMARNDPAPARRIALEASKIKYIPTPAKCKAHTQTLKDSFCLRTLLMQPKWTKARKSLNICLGRIEAWDLPQTSCGLVGALVSSASCSIFFRFWSWYICSFPAVAAAWSRFPYFIAVWISVVLALVFWNCTTWFHEIVIRETTTPQGDLVLLVRIRPWGAWAFLMQRLNLSLLLT